ncbi:MAG: flippase-like domain-containing protein [Deltaproteobacteria bacterium]|nr:flippase-like domain-containing protein [Deltaproteobacteria bacterium]
MKSNKRSLKIVLKVLLGMLVVGYVLHSRMVDFSALGAVIFRPLNLLLSFVFLAFSLVCVAIRWNYLVRVQKLSLPFKQVFSLTMIGSFFNNFMPGSVGGDLIKAWYMVGEEPQKKTRAVLTVLLDRAIGLFVIISYSAITLLFYKQWLNEQVQLRVLGFSLWAITGGGFLLVGLFFLPWNERVVKAIESLTVRLGLLGRIAQSLSLYRKNILCAAAVLVLSATSILGIIVLYSIQGNGLGIQINFSQYLFIVPMALTVSAIPLLPAGIGVGQVAFYTLFKWVGIENPEQGATLCTLVQIYTLLFNLIGGYFFIRYKKGIKKHLEQHSNEPASEQMSAVG